MTKKNLSERLAAGPVIGDGSMALTLEKRGYCTAGPWTPEAVVMYPEAVRQLLREYVRAGADVIQTPCFYSSDKKLKRGKVTYTAAEINDAACKIAKEVASEGDDVLICGGISPVESFVDGKGRDVVRKEFENQIEVFIKHDVDFLLAEYFGYIEELEICMDVVKKAGKMAACSMRIGPRGDLSGVSVEDCAVRMAKTGALMIGTNCQFDTNAQLKTLRRIKDALAKENLSPYLMCQPPGYLCPEVECTLTGQRHLPEAPILLETRILTRFEAHQFARSAYELGVRYIGGCCSTEPHHIRAFAQELAPEKKKSPPAEDMCPAFGALLVDSDIPVIRKRNTKEYWYSVKPGSGRPYNSPLVNVQAD
ncbi:betaine--homocysteine S-methyltransferase 1-like [Clavelina lepadiformis]|uniref:Hcy-binding domain-containing protein n=1 Tax=Clavelina lepadiformis TaxID=159417 RepID=A0ABP0FI84_CLALP